MSVSRYEYVYRYEFVQEAARETRHLQGISSLSLESRMGNGAHPHGIFAAVSSLDQVILIRFRISSGSNCLMYCGHLRYWLPIVAWIAEYNLINLVEIVF